MIVKRAFTEPVCSRSKVCDLAQTQRAGKSLTDSRTQCSARCASYISGRPDRVFRCRDATSRTSDLGPRAAQRGRASGRGGERREVQTASGEQCKQQAQTQGEEKGAPKDSFSKCIFLASQFSAALLAPYAAIGNGNAAPAAMLPPTVDMATNFGCGEARRRGRRAWKRVIVPITFTCAATCHEEEGRREEGRGKEGGGRTSKCSRSSSAGVSCTGV